MNTLTRRILVGTTGGIVLLAGLALLVLPGPAFVVIPLGLAILASEFPWARKWVEKLRAGGSRIFDKVRGKGKRG